MRSSKIQTILLIAASIVSLVACSHNSIDEIVDNSNSQIEGDGSLQFVATRQGDANFDDYFKSLPQSRAAISDDEDVDISVITCEQSEGAAQTRAELMSSFATDSKLSVFGYHCPDGSWDEAFAKTATPNIFLNQELYNSSKGFQYAPVQYWPGVGGVKFFGAYPDFGTSTQISLSSPLALSDAGYPTVMFNSSVNSYQQLDFMTATTDVRTIGQGTVPLEFKHRLARVAFKVVNENKNKGVDEVRIHSIMIGDVYTDAEGAYTADGFEWSALSDRQNLKACGDASSTPWVIAEGETSVADEAWHLNILPQTLASEKNITVNYSIGADTEIKHLRAQWSWPVLQGKVYILEIHFDDNTEPTVTTFREYSNCYLLTPSAATPMEYTIPVEGRIKEFWNDPEYNLNNNNKGQNRGIELGPDDWRIEVLWYDCDTPPVSSANDSTTTEIKLEKSEYIATDGTAEEAIKVTLGEGYNNPGNILVAVKQNSNNEILWSWHLWITEYNPDKPIDVLDLDINKAYQVEGGEIHRYSMAGASGDGSKNPKYNLYEGGVWTKNQKNYAMDRNLGARDVWDTNKEGRLYYQFGRKDPFPLSANAKSVTYTKKGIIKNNKANYTITTTSDKVTYAWAVNNPNKFICSDNVWCVSTTAANANEFAWDDKKIPVKVAGKSLFDPSPLGWKIPKMDTFSNFQYEHQARLTADGNGRVNTNIKGSQHTTIGKYHLIGQNNNYTISGAYVPLSGYLAQNSGALVETLNGQYMNTINEETGIQYNVENKSGMYNNKPYYNAKLGYLRTNIPKSDSNDAYKYATGLFIDDKQVLGQDRYIQLSRAAGQPIRCTSDANYGK